MGVKHQQKPSATLTQHIWVPPINEVDVGYLRNPILFFLNAWCKWYKKGCKRCEATLMKTIPPRNTTIILFAQKRTNSKMDLTQWFWWQFLHEEKKKKKTRWEEKKEQERQGSFWRQIFATSQTKKIGLQIIQRIFLGKKGTLSCHISRKNKLNLPYLHNRFLYVASI